MAENDIGSVLARTSECHECSRIIIGRTCPGLGDFIMMKPAVVKLQQQGYEVHVVSKSHYLALYEPMKNLHTEMPPVDAKLLDLGNPCPCAAYESANNPDIQKNRTQLFMEACGLEYRGESPKLNLTDDERAVSALLHQGKLRIGLSTVAGRYGDKLDGWRNYPHAEALAKRLLKLGEVIWLHDKPSRILGAQNFRGTIRELMVVIASLDVVVAVDSAPAHIAGALGVPVIGVFGPTDPELRLGQYPSATWVENYDKCGMAYCWYSPCKHLFCMKTLHPKSIVGLVESRLNAC